MSTLTRWLKFNLVGAMGIAVQLGSLALLNSWTRLHYLYASAAALELTLLHNFAWHTRYTWSDRREELGWKRQLLRFHLCNGFTSLVSNLALMHLFVRQFHVSVVAANFAAIVCCSLLNFWMGHCWTFATKATSKKHVCIDVLTQGD